MKGLPFVLLFTAMTFLSWGAYGPVLHHGAVALEHDSMRAFVGVGLAYFMIAVLFPFSVLKKSGEKGKWTLTGSIFSLVAGAVGAVGALGIILALGAGGETVYVMPLVFGFAPVVNTLVSAILSRTFNEISTVFIAGIVAAALGAAGVLVFKPVPGGPAETVAEASENAPAATQHTDEATDGAEQSGDPLEGDSQEPLATQPPSTDSDESLLPAERAAGESTNQSDADANEATPDNPSADSTKAEIEDPQDSATTADPPPDAEPQPSADEAESPTVAAKGRERNVFWIVVSIVIAALCWGSYGPMLHVGQARMQGSRLRPFACVGIAYFIIAVAAPLVLIYSRAEDVGAWSIPGMTWSFLAGVAGAVGALGVILAFNAGGKPYYVMPLIFGFAPVINTFISVTQAGTWNRVSFLFWLSLAVVIAGAVTVLTNAPRPKPKTKAEPKAA